MLLGCIGDDFTGSSDIANTLARGGMRVTQYCGTPDRAADPAVEAGIIALKSRTEPVADAVSKSLAAADWLLAQGCQQIVFKICSTFDSTPEGNIGPVAEALAKHIGENRVVVCPAFPATGRSVYNGHLFVNDQLLSESGMRNHPLTPMTDSDLRRWLGLQTSWPVEHINTKTVFEGPGAIAQELQSDRAAMIIVDAIRDDDLIAIGRAVEERKLLIGGSGIALGLPGNFQRKGLIARTKTQWSGSKGTGVVLSGSCSDATREQVTHYRNGHPSIAIDIDDLASGKTTADTVSAFLLENLDAAPLAFSSADPAVIARAQERYGRERSAAWVEQLFVDTARRLVAKGVTRIVTAGGETSGAVVEGLNIGQFEIGPEIATGVPAICNRDQGLYLALKSGNFGQSDFFERALAVLAQGASGAKVTAA